MGIRAQKPNIPGHHHLLDKTPHPKNGRKMLDTWRISACLVNI